MSDLIDRQAAIDAMCDACYDWCDEGVCKKVQAIQQLPSAQPELAQDLPNACTDAISRQAAIDAMEQAKEQYFDRRVIIEKMQNVVSNLPSAQPEIIRCKDCKHSEHWYKDKTRCFLWHETGIDVFEDGYCNYAKRRTDADMRGE